MSGPFFCCQDILKPTYGVLIQGFTKSFTAHDMLIGRGNGQRCLSYSVKRRWWDA